MTSRTAFRLDCTPVIPECGFNCARCLGEMESVLGGTRGVGKFYREGDGVVVEHDPGVIAVEQLLDIFRDLPSFYADRFVPTVVEKPGGTKLMAVSDEFVAYVVEQLSGWGEVSVRRMFGGAGLYRAGSMFAVIADDVAYLKVDDSNRDDFLRAGSAPFEPYPDKIKTTIRTFYEIPADVLEDRDVLAKWAERSWAIARRSKK